MKSTNDIDMFFDECECYFESPVDGRITDAIERLEGYDTEVRLAAIAFAKLCVEKAAAAYWEAPTE